MNFFKSLAVAAACVLAGPATAQSITIDQSFKLESLDWRGSTGRFIIMWRPIAIDGKLAVCGAYSARGSLDRATDRAMEAMDFYQDNRRVMRDMGFFNNVSSRHFDDALLGQQASCRVTNVAVAGAGSSNFALRLSKTRF